MIELPLTPLSIYRWLYVNNISNHFGVTFQINYYGATIKLQS